MKVKEESKIVGLNKTQRSKNEDHGIWSHHFMANRWRNNGNSDFIFLGSKITADCDCRVAETVKRLPTMRETQNLSLGQEDPLEKEMATHSSTLAWKISWTEELGRLQSMGVQELDRLSDFTFFSFSR